ncbi:hypothetical protein Xcel_0573 [Xylanimonas cellulosilytica DSM 15894]|uniref:Uncharacterized protein n=1 Tax=Xylanimonas cellulosilytica (strain DSM 15894 / JCM 12276 / CECT 5975 / KCTC 9989 / LMG 20990 / NBRC 107835 / XIL07) TaxID=446471 RepID=D1BWN0_XYLCX|nr:hypothetical protein [Xylanimonas cellulosilytica]ACZ29612.1 hypothetical protein Xcel_0573 [Xylanimonas cellulosilytica DSM 15894]
MTHLPETAFDGHRPEHVHHAGQVANGTRVVVLDPQGTPSGRGTIASFNPDDRRYRIALDNAYETHRHWDGLLPAPPDRAAWSHAETRSRPATDPASIPAIGRHETLFAVPNHRVAHRPSLVELDDHETAIAAILDAVGPVIADLREMDQVKAIDLDNWPTAAALIDAHQRLLAAQA